MLRNHPWNLLFASIALALAASCTAGTITVHPAEQSTTPAPTSRVTQTPTPASPVNTTPVQSPTVIPLTPAVRILAGDDLAVQIEFHDWEDLAGEQVLLMLSSEATLPEGGEVTLDYLTWDGERGSLATFYLKANTAIRAGLMTGGGNTPLLRYLPRPYSARESYIVDFARYEIRGFKEDCDLSLTMGIGSEFIAFACSEAKLTWHLLSILDPSTFRTISLPADLDPQALYYPVWVDDQRILLQKDFHSGTCTADAATLDPVCKDFSFWLGPMSPDGKWFEVRIGWEYAPDSMGIISSNCLTLADEGCFPIVAPAPPGMAPIDSASRNIADAVWLPNSSELLYIVTVNSDHTTMRSERSEIWHYDLGEKSIDLLYDLPGDFVFGDPRFELAPAPWSPDGSSVVVKDGGSFMLLNIETGKLTPLTEGGVLLGTITLP
jgi:hypothetical protein